MSDNTLIEGKLAKLRSAVEKRVTVNHTEACDCGRMHCTKESWTVRLPGTDLKTMGGSRESAITHLTNKVRELVVQQQVLAALWNEAHLEGPSEPTIWDLLTGDSE